MVKYKGDTVRAPLFQINKIKYFVILYLIKLYNKVGMS